MAWLRQAAEHDADHSETDEGGASPAVALEVTRHAAKTADPRECSFHDPALGQDFKSNSCSRTFNNLDPPSSGSGRSLRSFRSLIAAVAINALDEREQPTRAAIEHQRNAITILDAGRMHCYVQQQAERINENVPLSTLDLLARIKALRIERSPPV